MELRWLKSFVIVAEERHFTRAAERLQMAQPALSQQMQALERDLGFSLFDRTHRKQVRLTAAGQELFDRSKPILELADEARRETTRVARGLAGTLRLGFMGSATSAFLADLVQDFRAENPSLAVTMKDLSPEAQVAAIKSGLIDFGFARDIEDPELESTLLYHDELQIVTCDRCAIHDIPTLNVSLMSSLPMVAYARHQAPAMAGRVHDLCSRAGFEPNIVQETDSMASLLLLVASGVGYAIIPACTRFVGQSGTVFHRIEGSPENVPVNAIWRRGNPDRHVARWIEFVRSRQPEIQARMREGLFAEP